MSEDTKPDKDWADEFDDIRKKLSNARNIIENIADLMPFDVPELGDIHQDLHDSLGTIENLRWRLCSNPLERLLTGQQLTREEFYILAAQGILKIPSAAGRGEAFEEFGCYLYEDEERKGFIDPSENTEAELVEEDSTQATQPQIGIMPEDVRKSRLSPDQKAYFQKYKPDLFSRFRND